MDLEKKIGILLIAIGICIPLCTIPYLSGYSRDKGIFGNLYSLAIDLGADNRAPADQSITLQESHRKFPDFSKIKPRRIPFRFFLAATLIFFYMGVVRIDRARRREAGQREGSDIDTGPQTGS
jgi:hypothetical protein